MGKLLQALENGNVTEKMLQSVQLRSVDELRSAVRDRSQDQLRTFLVMGDFRPLLFKNDDDLVLEDIRRIYKGRIEKVTNRVAIQLFAERYQDNAKMMQLIGLDKIQQLDACISLLGTGATFRLFKTKKIPFALGLSPSERIELKFLLSKNKWVKVLADTERLKKDMDLGFGFIFQRAWGVSQGQLDTIIKVFSNPDVPDDIKSKILERLRKKKINKAIGLVNTIAPILDGRFVGVDASFVMAFVREVPSLQGLLCDRFKAYSFQFLNAIMSQFPKRVFQYFWKRKDFSGWPEDRVLWEDYINRLIDEGAYELIYTFDQLRRSLGNRSLNKQALCQAMGIDVHQFAFLVEHVDTLLRSYYEFLLDKAVKDRQLHLYLESLPRIMVESKNHDLIAQLAEKRDSMCGIGTRRLKLFLNRLMKNGDIIAQSYRLALELQDTNIVAKRQYGGYRDQAYEKKRNLLKELIGLCRKQGWVYGYQSSSVVGVDSVIYFELPYMEQISFHTRMRELGEGIPPYPKPWNGKENYTLIAIEEAIMSRYGEEIAALKNK